MARDKSVKLITAPPPRPPLRPSELLLGVDGGGTKTRAVLVDAHDRVVGQGVAGPSNPLRVGVSQAVAAVREAVERACAEARASRAQVAAAEVGLAGVKRADLRERMRAELEDLGAGGLEVVTDADIALYGATGGEAGLVIIAGTGSNCLGANARGKRAFAGGWGPIAGDEGSGSWIARRGLQAAARASDGRGPETALARAACSYFNVARPDDLSTAIYAPTVTHEHIAGFARRVVECAKKRDAAARLIVADAGRELGLAAAAVVRRLRMERESFTVGYVGGVFEAGQMLLGPLRKEVLRAAPKARLGPPPLGPAEAAARMARRQLALALAG